jgi:hypothetical protein
MSRPFAALTVIYTLPWPGVADGPRRADRGGARRDARRRPADALSRGHAEGPSDALGKASDRPATATGATRRAEPAPAKAGVKLLAQEGESPAAFPAASAAMPAGPKLCARSITSSSPPTGLYLDGSVIQISFSKPSRPRRRAIELATLPLAPSVDEMAQKTVSV